MCYSEGLLMNLALMLYAMNILYLECLIVISSIYCRMVFWLWICDTWLNQHMAISNRSSTWESNDACLCSQVILMFIIISLVQPHPVNMELPACVSIHVPLHGMTSDYKTVDMTSKCWMKCPYPLLTLIKVLVVQKLMCTWIQP